MENDKLAQLEKEIEYMKKEQEFERLKMENEKLRADIDDGDVKPKKPKVAKINDDNFDVPEQLIPKKIAAQECYNRIKQAYTICLVGIASAFIVALVGTFNKFAGAGSAGLVAMGYAFFAFKAKQDMTYLGNTYKIGKQQIGKNV
jgi:regulator of replication initiation timing